MVNVEVYIKVNEYTNTSQPLVDSFEARVLADGGTFEAGSCLLSDIESLGGQFQYTDVYKRLDLYKDEKISLTSSIQNVNDLSKVFTDYTQSFTVPASKTNNQIFNYWNESAVNDGFDQRIRYDALIEINTIPFKKGQIQIEKANEKDNRIESFSVTFYGKVKQIKDLFKDDKLSFLDYSALNHPYTFDEIKDRIDGTIVGSVFYPLVGNKNKYEYLTASPYDVTVGGTTNQSIVYTDLLPAIPVRRIFEYIEDRYNVTFNSTLFGTSYWQDLYLYCKNNEQTANFYEPKKINWTSKDSIFPDLDLTTDNYTLKYTFDNNTTVVDFQRVFLSIYPTVPTIEYKLIMRKGGSPNFPQGSIHQEWNGLMGNQINLLITEVNLVDASPGYFWFEIQSNSPITFYTELYNYKFNYTSGAFEFKTGYAASQSTSTNINIKNYVPDIKVTDFFSGIIKMFNLTITATNETEFNLEPLEFYYAYGNYVDINSYVINDSVDIERTKLFKKLSFNHEKSENILNNYFRNTFQRGYDYGDLIYEDDLSNESSTYEIKTPFEDVMWERATDSDFQTTSLIDKDLKPYKPKPILMYRNGLQSLSTDIKLYTGSSYYDLGIYQRFSNELFINSDIASLNFGEEQSSWNLNGLATNSLFNLWYKNYISGLYDIRCRIVKLKAIMPITKLADIKLNDKIVYKDKKYIINQFTTDLTTGEVDFELVSDFRAVTNSSTGNGGRFALKEVFNIDNSAQDLEVTILKLDSEYYDVKYDDTSYDSSGNYIDDTFIVPIDANTTGDIVIKQIEITYHNPDAKQYINIIQYA